MADLNHLISLGIGTPADIKHFTLFGLTPVSAVNGSLDQSIGNFALSATGTLDIAGSLSASIGTFALTSTGTLAISGSLSASIGTFTLTAIGGLPVTVPSFGMDAEYARTLAFDAEYVRFLSFDAETP